MLSALALSVWLLSSCRGGDGEAVEQENDGDSDGVEASDDSELTDGDSEAEMVVEVPTLACPFPAELPFDLESEGFINEDSAKLAEEATFLLGENMDVIGLPDAAQTINGSMVRGTNGIMGKPFAGEWISLFKPLSDGTWGTLGRVQADEDGYYTINVPEEFAYGIGNGTAYSVLEGDGSCAVHGIFLWPTGTQAVISDIDGTLTLNDQELMKQINDQSYDQLENTSSAELMQTWHDKGYMNIYLTARPHTFREPTRKWLEEHGFPFGPVITANELVFDESARTYKREWVKRITEEFGWNIVAAYGNATSDIDAYNDAGIPLNITFIIGENAGVGGTVAIPDNDFSQHIRDYVKNQPDAVQPF